jgi:hypothetical protein
MRKFKYGVATVENFIKVFKRANSVLPSTQEAARNLYIAAKKIDKRS